jgi:hypothetical protein
VIEGLTLLLNLHKLKDWKLINHWDKEEIITDEYNYLVLCRSTVALPTMKSVKHLFPYPNVSHHSLFAHYFSHYSSNYYCYFCMAMEMLIVHYEIPQSLMMDAFYFFLYNLIHLRFYFSSTSAISTLNSIASRFQLTAFYLVTKIFVDVLVTTNATKKNLYTERNTKKLCLISQKSCNWMAIAENFVPLYDKNNKFHSCCCCCMYHDTQPDSQKNDISTMEIHEMRIEGRTKIFRTHTHTQNFVLSFFHHHVVAIAIFEILYEYP